GRVAVGGGEDPVGGTDRGADRHRAEDDTDATGEVLDSGCGAFAAGGGEREGERLREREDDRAGEGDDGQCDEQRRERVRYRGDEQPDSVDDARPAKRADDSVAVGEPAGDRRSRNV